MGSLSVRNVDDEVIALLRVRAARHGVSMEEEARRVLRAAVTAPERLGDLAFGIFGPDNGVHVDVPPAEAHEPPIFAE